MCGIHGFNREDHQLIDKMVAITRHRGKDSEGVLVDGGWSLGHNRLSILDLSTAGYQPMESRDERFVIVFNGEIYNFLEIRESLKNHGYKFQSDTDTEVVLYSYIEWGANCLEKFNGIFAFAILDKQTSRIFLARDRFGIKPLYYYHKNQYFAFASEIKSLIVNKDIEPLSLKREAVNIYFRMFYVPAPLTVWENIYKLEPGSYAIVEKEGSLSVERYWRFNPTNLVYDRTYIKAEINRILHASVKMQLISDRPVGVFLSGGIDSTIIAGIANEYSPNIQTFSVGFEDTPQSEKYNKDMKIAARTAQYFGTTHNEYVLSAKEVAETIPSAVYHMDEPISNHVQAVNLLLAKAVADKATVVLSGDGGDELFGGYERYYYNSLIDKAQRIPGFQSLAATISCLDSRWKERLRKASLEPGVDRYLDFFAQKELIVSSFLKSEFNMKTVTSKIFEELYFQEIDKNNFTRQFMRTDILSWLPNESLVRTDKMCMAAGVEARVPFLDHNLVEFADRIPVEYKLGKKWNNILTPGQYYRGKIILRDAMRDYLPDFVLSQSKWGWFSPAAKWIRGPLLKMVREVLSPGYNSETKNILDLDAVNHILEDHLALRRYDLNTIWSVFTFQLWYHRFFHDK